METEELIIPETKKTKQKKTLIHHNKFQQQLKQNT